MENIALNDPNDRRPIYEAYETSHVPSSSDQSKFFTFLSKNFSLFASLHLKEKRRTTIQNADIFITLRLSAFKNYKIQNNSKLHIASAEPISPPQLLSPLIPAQSFTKLPQTHNHINDNNILCYHLHTYLSRHLPRYHQNDDSQLLLDMNL